MGNGPLLANDLSNYKMFLLSVPANAVRVSMISNFMMFNYLFDDRMCCGHYPAVLPGGTLS